MHTLDPNKSKVPVKIFQDYSHLVFLPYLECMLQYVGRLDVGWDVYKENSLKAHTRQNRGAGNHLRVANNTNILDNWNNFLHCDSNKKSLFQLLANAIQFQPPQRKLVISTHGKNAVSSPIADLSDLPCTHEEADTRLLFHASRSFHQGFTKLMIHVTDTDVVVLAIAVSSVLKDCEIWVAFGHGSKLSYVPCHLISAELGNDEVFCSCMRYQDLILFPPSMELERKQLVLYGVVSLSSYLLSFVYLLHQFRYPQTKWSK